MSNHKHCDMYSECVGSGPNGYQYWCPVCGATKAEENIAWTVPILQLGRPLDNIDKAQHPLNVKIDFKNAELLVTGSTYCITMPADMPHVELEKIKRELDRFSMNCGVNFVVLTEGRLSIK